MRCSRIPLLLALQAAVLAAATTQSWEVATYGDFLAGTFRNVALEREGVVRVAPSLDLVHESDQAVVWSVARAPDGSIYYGTGHQGAVFRVGPSGSGELLWKAPEIEVFALAVGRDGSVYAGTSPNGKVYKIGAGGVASEFFDPEDDYIWSLVFDQQGHLIVATGAGGQVYRVRPDGTGQLWFESGQRHAMSVALDASGNVLVGTDPDGVLYRVSSSGAGFALHDSDLPEVRGVTVGSDGAIYFAAMGGGMDRVLQTIPGSTVTGVDASLLGSSQFPVLSPPGVSSTVTYARPEVVYAGERAALMRIVDGQAVEKLWTSNEEQLLGMSLDPTRAAGVLFATDHGGRIYRTGPDRHLSVLSQSSTAELTVLAADGDGVLAGSAHGAALYRLSSRPAPSGVYETVPRDTGGVSAWGQLSWRARVPEGASLEIRTRSGNMQRPGPGWSRWSEPLADGEGSPVASPPARFLQWQATLRGDVTLDALRVHYLPQNSAPVVRSVNVVPETVQADSAADGQAPASNSYSITVSASGESTPPTPASNQNNSESERKLAIIWSAHDPDGDNLRAEISFRGEGETMWKTIRKHLPGPKFAIDGDALADGLYEFRVQVDDGLVNPADRALSADRISGPVLVDRTPPSITVLPAAAGAPRFQVSDALSTIRVAEYSVDAGDWTPVLADDGLLDARDETFTLRLADLEPGEHLVVLRVRDRAGNTALGKALVR